MAVERPTRRKARPPKRVPRATLHAAILAALADGGTCTRDELRNAVPQIAESTAWRLIRAMCGAGMIHARRTAPGAANALRFALTVEALHAMGTTTRVSSVRLTLNDGARYRVLTAPCAIHSQGRVMAGMIWRAAAGAFQAPKGAVQRLPLASVEAVYASAAAGFIPVSQCDLAPPKTLEPYVPPSTIGAAVIALLQEHGPLTVREIRDRLPQYRGTVLRTTVGHMAHAETVSRHGEERDGCRVRAKWGIGPVPYEKRPSRGRVADVDTWTPQPWVNPIRRRLLGLPVARAPRVEPETDYAHPTRRAA